jgi:hypothetical protein
MGADDMFLMFLPFGCGSNDDRLLVDRFLHRQFDGADEVCPLAERGAVREGGEA